MIELNLIKKYKPIKPKNELVVAGVVIGVVRKYKKMAGKPREFVLSVASWPNAIAHIDADAFFVACEVATNPTLKDECVVVGRERGIVTALNYSAKAKGIKKGMLISEVKRICPDLIVIESDYEKCLLI